MMNSYGHGFYLTLPSESSKDLFPENNASEYNVRLPHWIDLKGNWEIGLHSITLYPTEHNPPPRRDNIIRVP